MSEHLQVTFGDSNMATVPIGTRIKISNSPDIMEELRGREFFTIDAPQVHASVGIDYFHDGKRYWNVAPKYFTVLAGPEPVKQEKVVSTSQQIYAKRLLVED